MSNLKDEFQDLPFFDTLCMLVPHQGNIKDLSVGNIAYLFEGILQQTQFSMNSKLNDNSFMSYSKT